MRTGTLNHTVILVVLAALAGCGSPVQPSTPSVPASSELGLSACSIAPGEAGYEEVETSCDGLDNDCDGLTDVLLPIDANACTTGAEGACGHGVRACVSGAPVCLAPAPVAETTDGVDNDCDGDTDEGAAGQAVRPRIRVMVPPYLWEEDPEIVRMTRQSLDQQGIPYDADESIADWDAAFDQLGTYAVVVMPGYVGFYAFSGTQLEELALWVNQGGTLVLTRVALSGEPEDAPLLELIGATTATNHPDVDTVVLAPAAATLALDSVEERWVPVTGPDAPTSDVFTYGLSDAADVRAIGNAYNAAGTNLGPALLRRAIGQGRVYTLGEDFNGFGAQRCYVNCFDPGRDLYGLLLRGILREAARGHTVLKHTVPAGEDSILIVSHDVDAPDSHNDGIPWGRAGAIQMAEMEVEREVQSTWFVQTNYVEGYYNAETIATLFDMGMRAFGGHSNLHLDWETMPHGVCTVTRSTYAPDSPTVCGEVNVNFELLQKALPEARLDLWRSPLLSISPQQFVVLAERGVLYDSSFATGDLRTNLPLATDRIPYDEATFQGAHLYTVPIHAEDGLGFMDDGGKERRVELQDRTYRRFLTSWTYTMLQNRRNGAWTVLLVHPSWGQGVGPENLPVKIAAVREMIDRAKTYGIPTRTLAEAGDFWRGRDGVAVDATWDPSVGYSIAVDVGPVDAPELSLEFGDTIGTVDCIPVEGHCPKTRARGARIVFEEPLPAGSRFTLRATPMAPEETTP